MTHRSPASALQHRRTTSVSSASPQNWRRHPVDKKRVSSKSNCYIVPLSVIFVITLASGFLIYRRWTTPDWNARLRDDSNGNFNRSAWIDSATKIPVPPISAQHSFASLGHLESAVSTAWKEATDTIEQRSFSLFRHWFEDDARRLFDLPAGIPGTGIDTAEEAISLQAYLDCYSTNGEWVYEPNGSHLGSRSLPVHKHSSVLASCDKAYYENLRGEAQSSTTDRNWRVRPSLKWYWKPSDACRKVPVPDWMKGERSLENFPLVSRSTLCTYLRHKNLLLIGDSPTQYLLHDLLLDWTSSQPLTCYGDLYCREHAICPDHIITGGDVRRQWHADVRVFDRLRDTPEQHTNADRLDNSSNSDIRKLQTRGTVLRYRRADSMFMNSSPSHARHQPAFIHPHTGVRDINMYSVADGRRSDLTILHKAPIAYPRQSKGGSFVNSHMLELTAALEESTLPLSEKLTYIVQLATIATTEVWLPELVESLRALKAPPASSKTLLIYRGGWNMQQSCGQDSVLSSSPIVRNKPVKGDGNQPFPSVPDLGQILFSSFSNSTLAPASADLRTAYYNAQNVLQNEVMWKVIAPRLGLPYLNLDTPTRIWRSGFVGGSRATQSEVTTLHLAANLRDGDRQAVDCLRMCLPSPGLSLETFFITSLARIFEWGWSGPDRNRTWVGDDFAPVRSHRKTQMIKPK